MKKVVYMEWVKMRPPVKYELAGSAVMPVSIADLPEARDKIDINDFNLYGYRPLLEKIAARYEVKPSQVVTTQGTSMANYLACAAVLSRGDEVLIEKPAYEPLLGIARLLGARIKRFNRPFRRGFQFEVADLAKRISSRTRLIVLTNMHNPSGVLTSNEVLREVQRLARRVGAYIVIDEVYLDFLEKRPKSAVHLGPNMIVTSSLTKAFGFDGLRCGWILTSPQLAKEIWRLQDFFGVNGAVPAEKISVAAFEHLDRFLKRTMSILRKNRPLVERFLDDHAKELSCVLPDGGPVCFPRLNRRESARAFAAHLLRKYNTAVTPGHFFEMPQHFRLGFGGPTEILRGGLKQLSRALKR
jgi:aspartate/methionine/tyrosine aminotransferase